MPPAKTGLVKRVSRPRNDGAAEGEGEGGDVGVAGVAVGVVGAVDAGGAKNGWRG
jgi:hypothetical protein